MAFMRKDPKTATRIASFVFALAFLSALFLRPGDPKTSTISDLASGLLFGMAIGMGLIAVRMKRNNADAACQKLL